MTVMGMCDEFPVDESFGVMCEVLDGGEEVQSGRAASQSELPLELKCSAPDDHESVGSLRTVVPMPLSELEVAPDNPSFQTVNDYITWFVNAPEDDVEDGVDGDWDVEDDEDEYWEDEEDDLEDGDLDGVEEENAAWQKVGRNDPCPCGSGKKFKKCCLRKQNGDAMLD
ncbi:MAG: SEC-C metal-binding domain-containing protein [Thermoguttaceae bacterium]